MRVDINPFYSRASESIGLDDRFIKLFSPDVLEIFGSSSTQVWDIVNILRSSPGGGKTTLLRLFTPEILMSIKEKHRAKDEQAFEILKKLQLLNVFDAKFNPIVVGTLIPFTSEYSTLDFLNIDNTQKSKLFFSLLNVRIILSGLSSICKIHKLSFPEDLNKISIVQDPSKVGFNPLRLISNGKEIYDWACEAEERICNAIDSIYLTPDSSLEKATDLYALQLLNPGNIRIDGQPFRERLLIMFDDVHNLSANQRETLLNDIVNKRPAVNVWLAERLQALSMEEIISEGNVANRDFNIITLEQYWNKPHSNYEKFTKSIANKRLSTITEGEPTSLSTYLSEEFDVDSLKSAEKYLETIIERIKKRFGRDPKYVAWIKNKEEFEGEVFEKLIEWKSLEILLHRDAGKQQQMLQFEEVLDENELEHQDGSDVKEAARLFLNYEFHFPYYYGVSKISRLSSSNVEQFLTICGKLFENIVIEHVKKISRNNQTSIHISAKKQELFIKRLCEEKWREMDIRVPGANNVKKFINNIGEFCKEQTYTPNAWNSPGINGVAITMSDRNMLKDKALMDESHQYHDLAKCIATCIAYNLIDFRLNYKCKGKFLMILYLNRLYCARYGLPLANGKFKERRLTDLREWTKITTPTKNYKLGL